MRWRLQILNSLAACRIWFITYNNIKICFQDISESHQAMNTSKISLSWSPKSWWYPRWSQTLQYHPTGPWKIESIEDRIDTWSPKFWIKSYQTVEGKVNAWYEIGPWGFKDRNTDRRGQMPYLDETQNQFSLRFSNHFRRHYNKMSNVTWPVESLSPQPIGALPALWKSRSSHPDLPKTN